MAVNITFDNDRTTTGIQDLTLDEDPGVQTPATADDGNDTDVTNTGGTIGGLTTVMNDILNAATVFGFGAFQLSAAQEAYIALVDGASSSLDFVKVEVTNGEVIDDLFFSDANGQPLNGDQVVGMQTLDGEDVFLWSSGDLCIATTSATLGEGRIVAVFCLHEDTTDHLEAQIQFVALEPLSHPDGTDADDTLAFTDVLNVSASGSISFDFDNLESGNFLWVAIGNSSAGLLVTGQDLNVNDTAGAKQGDMTKGGSDPSDSMNTSQGGINATIGVNAQHFTDGPKVNGADTDGPVAVFTLVDGFVPLDNNPDEQATGTNVKQIDYDDYIDTSSVDIFISQTVGNDDATMKISLFNASLVGSTPEEGYSGANPYIGNQDTDSALTDDAEVNVGSVTIGSDTWLSTDAGIGSGITKNGITVSINGNDVVVDGVTTADTITVEALSGTFNRFTVQGLAGTADFDIGRIDIDNVVGDTEAVGGQLLVDDDGPVINPLINNGSVQYVVAATDSDLLNGASGTDVSGSFEITAVSPSTTNLLGVTLTARIDPNDNTLVNIYQDLNATDGFQSGAGGDLLYYTLSLQDLTTAGDGTITGDLDSWVFTVHNAPSAPPLEFNFAGLPSGQNLFGMVASAGAPNGPGVLFFGEDSQIKNNGEFTNTSDTINTSQGGGPTTIGNTNQMVDQGEGIYFTIINDPADAFLANVTGGLDQNEADDADNMDFASLREVASAFFRVSQTQGNDEEAASIEAFNITKPADDRDILTASGQNHVDIVKVNVWADFVGGDLLETSTGTDGGLDADITVTIDSDGIAHVIGLESGYVVEWITDDPSTMAVEKHDQALITGEAGKFDIGGFGISEAQQVPDHFYDFTVKLTDADGDFVTDTFRVEIDAAPFVV